MKPIGLMIKQLHMLHMDTLNQLLKQYGLTSSQGFVLIYLIHNMKKQIEVNQKDIEKEFDISNPTVTGILNRLQNKGLIERIVCSSDARKNQIIVTKEALALDEEMKKGFKEQEEAMLKGFNDEEMKLLRELLEKMMKNLGGTL